MTETVDGGAPRSDRLRRSLRRDPVLPRSRISFRPTTARSSQRFVESCSAGPTNRPMAADLTSSSSAAESPEPPPPFPPHGLASRSPSFRTGPCWAATAAPRSASGPKEKPICRPTRTSATSSPSWSATELPTDGNAKVRRHLRRRTQAGRRANRTEYHAAARATRQSGGVTRWRASRPSLPSTRAAAAALG